MADRRESSSHPPSDPHPALARGLFAVEERPVRIQLFGALTLGLVLVGTGLFLWRRPHVPADAQAAESAAASASAQAGIVSPAPSASAPAASLPVTLSDARVVGCHDRGSKKTAPDQCDRIPALEKALSDAIEKAATCVPPSANSATIEYVADVSFSRHKVGLLLPRDGRSVKDKKVLHACSTAIRGTIQGLTLDGIDHQHARYSIAVRATYRGSATGG
jgi:hypothetical protein